MGQTAKEQTDFGGIYFHQPKEIVQPRTAQELAQVLKKYHKLGEPVRIRNTGHSVNGQSLTDGVQIQTGGINKLHFDRNRMEVTAGAGTTWDEIFKEINFPEYSIAVFPNNPGQKIKVGGTVSVGGIGPFSAKYGGLWNQVLELKLVTMTGEIITCSRTENPEIFKYSLGGFGRIGVISEVTLRCIPSKKEIIWLGLIYHNFEKLFKHLDKALLDPTYEGAFLLEQLNHVSLASKFGVDPSFMNLMVEVTEGVDLAEIVDYAKKTLECDLMTYGDDGSFETDGVCVSLKAQKFLKKDLVYFYPKEDGHSNPNLYHPWGDFVVTKANYMRLCKEAKAVLKKYDLTKYLLQDSLLHGLLPIDIFITYCIRNISSHRADDFPLSLDLKEARDYYLVLSVLPAVPANKVDDGLKAQKELADLVYKMGGKQYLYGSHSLSKEQIEQHFGRSSLQKWQKVKDKLDPKHLLNIGVIEHLD